MFFKDLIKYILNKIKYRRKVKFYFTSRINPKSECEGANMIHRNTSFIGKIGYGSYIGANCSINARIGRFTSIASNCSTISGIHPYTYPYCVTSPMFFSLNKQTGHTFAKEQVFKEGRYADEKTKTSVLIGNDCWINAKVTIISGVKVSDGAVLLAGSVITKDVPPYAIVGGVPGRILKYRYSQDDINFLLDFKWWNRDLTWLRDNWRILLNIEKLKDYAKQYEANQ